MSILDIIPGGSYLQNAISIASTKISAEKAIVTGKIGKVYYGAQGAVYDAVGSTAKAAETVTTGIRNYSLYAMLAIGFVLAWPFIAPLLAQSFGSLAKKVAH